MAKKDPKDIESLLGEEPESGDASKEPGLTGAGEEKNPLEKMDEISKAKPGKKESDSRSLDEDTVEEMLKTGENTEGMFTPDEEEEHENEDKKSKVKVGKKVTPSEKYKDQFKNDMLKHPDEYKIQTPRGEMTVSEAIRAGYDPLTKTFNAERSQEGIREKHLAGLNETDREALTKFTDPATAAVAPADAEMYGLPSGSPMIKQPDAGAMVPPTGAPAAQPASPTMGATGSPVGQALPGAQESVAPGGVDLSALLGGGQ